MWAKDDPATNERECSTEGDHDDDADDADIAPRVRIEHLLHQGCVFARPGAGGDNGLQDRRDCSSSTKTNGGLVVDVEEVAGNEDRNQHLGEGGDSTLGGVLEPGNSEHGVLLVDDVGAVLRNQADYLVGRPDEAPLFEDLILGARLIGDLITNRPAI